MRAKSSTRDLGHTAKPPDGLSRIRIIPHPDHPACGSQRFKCEKGYTVPHKFSVGQAVVLVPRVLQPAAPGEYEVLQLMPAGDREPGDPSYRIKSIDEKHERVVVESDLTPVERADAAL
jgi:hypothetical protein